MSFLIFLHPSFCTYFSCKMFTKMWDKKFLFRTLKLELYTLIFLYPHLQWDFLIVLRCEGYLKTKSRGFHNLSGLWDLFLKEPLHFEIFDFYNLTGCFLGVLKIKIWATKPHSHLIITRNNHLMKKINHTMTKIHKNGDNSKNKWK